MKIVFLKKLYSPVGGSETLTYQWARRLAARGHEVRVLALWPAYRRHGFPSTERSIEPGVHYRAFEDGGVAVYQLAPHLGLPGKLLDILPFFQLLRAGVALRLADGCDVIHNVCREYPAAARAIARHYGVPLVVTPLPHPGQPFSGASKADIAGYRRADGIVAMTAHEKRWYESKGVAGDRVAVIAAGAAAVDGGDGASFRARHGIAGPMVLFVGRQEAYKGYLAVAAAAKQVWEAHADACFVFIGEKSLASRLHDPLTRYRDRRILNLGVVGEEEKAAAYAASDLFAMPSTHETLGLTYLEAWQYAKPVIGGDIPPLREVIEDGVDGLLVPRQAAAVARAINSLLGDTARARTMGEAGRRKVVACYAWPAVIARLEAFYSCTIARIASRAP